jgi:hypothetical protein
MGDAYIFLERQNNKKIGVHGTYLFTVHHVIGVQGVECKGRGSHATIQYGTLVERGVWFVLQVLTVQHDVYGTTTELQT